MKSSSKQICAHAEEADTADTVSASSACVRAEGKKGLVQVLSGTGFCCLCGRFFFKHGAQSSVKVRGEVCTAVLNTLNLLEHL